MFAFQHTMSACQCAQSAFQDPKFESYSLHPGKVAGFANLIQLGTDGVARLAKSIPNSATRIDGFYDTCATLALQSQVFDKGDQHLPQPASQSQHEQVLM